MTAKLVHQSLVEGEASSPQPNIFVAENASQRCLFGTHRFSRGKLSRTPQSDERLVSTISGQLFQRDTNTLLSQLLREDVMCWIKKISRRTAKCKNFICLVALGLLLPNVCLADEFDKVVEIDNGVVTYSSGKTIPIDHLPKDAREAARNEFSRYLAKNPDVMARFTAHDVEINASKQKIQEARHISGAGYRVVSDTEKANNMAREMRYRSQELSRAAASQAMAWAMINDGVSRASVSAPFGLHGSYYGRVHHANGYYRSGAFVRGYYRR